MTPLGTGERVTSCSLQHFLCISDFHEEILVTHYQNITFHTFIPEETKQIRSSLACPFTSIRCAVSPSGNSQCFQEFLLCTWTSGTSQVGSNSCWNQEPKPTNSGLPSDRKSPPFQGQSCWSPRQHNCLLYAAMGK